MQVLDGVVITGRVQDREVIAPQKLSGKEIEKLNVFSVADAIRFFSGVQLKDYGGVGGLKTIDIRSMGTNQVGVFYNGIQLGNAQNGQVDLGKFSMDNIDEISLYNGQKSQVFQSARDFSSASSVYITSRRPRFIDGKETNIKTSVKGGSFDLINPSLLLEHKISDNVSMSFNGEWLSSSGKYKVHYKRTFFNSNEVAYDTTGTRQNGRINASRLEAFLYGSLPGGSWNIHAYNYSSDRGVPGPIINGDWWRGEQMRDINSFMQGSFKKEISSRWSTLLNVKYASDYTHFENLVDEKALQVSNKFRQKEFYISSANLFPITRFWDVSFSYDFQWNKLDAEFEKQAYNTFSHPTRYSHWVSLATSLDLNRLKIQASALGVFVHETVKRYTAHDDEKVFAPAVFASYKLLANEDLKLNVFYKKAFRVATFNELYYVEVVSADIRPEYTTQYNAALKYVKSLKHSVFKNIDAQVNVYYNEVDDKIIATPKPPQFRWETYNLDHVKIRGIDVSVGTAFNIDEIQFTTKLQYTYQKSQDFSSKGKTYYKDQIPYIPWHSGTVIASATYKDWMLNYSFIYTGERYAFRDNILPNYLQPWYTHDLSLIKPFKINNMNFKATFEVNNLLSQDYEVVINYPMPKRNYRISLVVEF
ncbi:MULTISPECIES: TonB-dependent receptor [unclassified Dysgonomonas]|uniref:TonB-dependent receptor n=1 Tax=unclassified Dysgonomonas TaxID=2630389 RepID=UPI0024741444|nr:MULTISPECIES: TonB-dependent receptor plug domain-containing protein [unclassified Dysgonomonas]